MRACSYRRKSDCGCGPIRERGVRIVFVRQPELSTSCPSASSGHSPQAKLLLAIYSYFAEAEREYISLHTKQGLAAAKAKGVKLGRPKGRRNKMRRLDPYQISGCASPSPLQPWCIEHIAIADLITSLPTRASYEVVPNERLYFPSPESPTTSRKTYPSPSTPQRRGPQDKVCHSALSDLTKR